MHGAFFQIFFLYIFKFFLESVVLGDSLGRKILDTYMTWSLFLKKKKVSYWFRSYNLKQEIEKVADVVKAIATWPNPRYQRSGSFTTAPRFYVLSIFICSGDRISLVADYFQPIPKLLRAPVTSRPTFHRTLFIFT